MNGHTDKDGGAIKAFPDFAFRDVVSFGCHAMRDTRDRNIGVFDPDMHYPSLVAGVMRLAKPVEFRRVLNHSFRDEIFATLDILGAPDRSNVRSDVRRVHATRVIKTVRWIEPRRLSQESSLGRSCATKGSGRPCGRPNSASHEPECVSSRTGAFLGVFLHDPGIFPRNGNAILGKVADSGL
jgi:hypothetical protein